MRKLGLLLLVYAASVVAQHEHHHNMRLDARGMVMHENEATLPEGCSEISTEHSFEIYAGASYAKKYHNKVFAYSAHTLKVEPCSRVRVTFINDDEVRHQWMVHGLPRYLYGQGMFHLEAAGGQRVQGVLIVPPDHKTYLVHCDIAQHMEKGMKAQLVVGNGSGNLWAVPGVSAPFIVQDQLPPPRQLLLLGGIGFVLTASVAGYLARSRR